uniref:NADPH oxidase organizer 1 n=1 Tax=Varanus komodoensis TaxID=61221 RepID=A0A8D2LP80_VARKO
ERTIPRLLPVCSLKDVNVMLRKKQALSQGMHSLKLLEDYCQELLKTQPKIIQGEDVVQFFGAQSRDLDPAFPENSILVLPSEMGARKAEAPPRPASLGITQPVIAQVYRCLEAFDTDDTKGRPFKALKGETLEVLMKDKTGWWLVENCKKQIAWFPAPYLEQAEEDATTREHSGEGASSHGRLGLTLVASWQCLPPLLSSASSTEWRDTSRAGALSANRTPAVRHRVKEPLTALLGPLLLDRQPCSEAGSPTLVPERPCTCLQDQERSAGACREPLCGHPEQEAPEPSRGSAALLPSHSHTSGFLRSRQPRLGPVPFFKSEFLSASLLDCCPAPPWPWQARQPCPPSLTSPHS